MNENASSFTVQKDASQHTLAGASEAVLAAAIGAANKARDLLAQERTPSDSAALLLKASVDAIVQVAPLLRA